MYPGVWPEGWLGSFVHPLGGVVCRGHAQYPAFATNSLFLLLALQKWQLGFFGVFLYLLFRICPNCTCTQLLLVPSSFFLFCGSWRGAFRCKHCSTAAEGPRSQPVTPSLLKSLEAGFLQVSNVSSLEAESRKVSVIKLNQQIV